MVKYLSSVINKKRLSCPSERKTARCDGVNKKNRMAIKGDIEDSSCRFRKMWGRRVRIFLGDSILDDLNFYGLALGAVSFLIIGLFHPLVIKGEYYFGRKFWFVFLGMGMVASGLSLITEGVFGSVTLGVLGFSSFWGIKEVFEQEQRVKDGRFPMNPKRKR